MGVTGKQSLDGLDRPAAQATRPLAVRSAVIIKRLLGDPGRQAVLRRVGSAVSTLLVIAYLTLFGLIMAERGRAGLPAAPLAPALEAVSRTATYLVDHPATYTWQRVEVPALSLVAVTFGRSAGLLLIALALATAVGVPLGITLALRRRGRGAPLVVLLSVLGISTPSFLLAMLFWVINIWVYRRLGLPALPPAGFGWDAHLVMPALVLAARPLAQVVQITYVALSDVLGQDYIRTAQAKGLPRRLVLTRHAFRNVTIPVLTTLGMSLRLSLASLPVVEFFFLWPGLGFTLLQAIELGITPLVVDLILALGLLFLCVNMLLELIYPRLDPRLKQAAQGGGRQERRSLRDRLRDLAAAVSAWLTDLRRALPGLPRDRPQLPPLLRPTGTAVPSDSATALASAQPRRLLRSVFGNPALVIGSVLVVAFFGLALFGERLTDANPYETHGTMTIEGQIGTPPFRPSTVFPWGSDPVGRDVQALVLAGFKRTLALALFAMVARVAVGTLLGALAGWWHGSFLDRFIVGAIGVWAAFPVTLFAMILILALGIQQGMIVFVIALCVVGWGEIAQFVRGQVIGIKPQLHIEAARAVGLRPDQILTQNVLPTLLPSLIVLAVLEMGGVLMLLAELGFLDIFLGGGFRVQIGEVGRMQALIYHFSDVPEWGALLANIRNWWRSYPWLAWYPGLAFFAAILAFNLWGEGLRRFLDETPLNVGRLFNRYAVVTAGVLIFGLVSVLRGTAPVGLYRSQAQQFEAARALEDIRALASPQFQGRETGTPGAKLASEYIAERMKAVGLFPGGENETYRQTYGCPRTHLAAVPSLEILDGQGNVAASLEYRRDFVEYIDARPTYGKGEGAVVGLMTGPSPNASSGDAYRLNGADLRDKVILVREEDVGRISTGAVAGVLVVADDPATLQRKYLFPRMEGFRTARSRTTPVMTISPETAERVLATTNTSLAQLIAAADGLQPGAVAVTDAGATVRLATPIKEEDLHEQCYNVVGYLPGTGSAEGLDSQVILVSAYYDGLGTGPDGTLYPGANDNASGVAAMLEMARVLKQGAYQPKKTVIFVAWAEGERAQSLSVINVMNAKIGFNQLEVEAIIELGGLGAGDGRAIALGQGSSYRLVRLFQEAANRMDVASTTRGRPPHFGLETRTGFGGRSATTVYVSWDGSDRTAHTTADTLDTIDPRKLEQSGQTTLLVLSVLSREVNY